MADSRPRSVSISSEEAFRSQSLTDALAMMKSELQKLSLTAPAHLKPETEQNFEGFERLFERYVTEAGTTIDWDKIQPPPKEMVIAHDSLGAAPQEASRGLLNKLAVLKLNGGLGTSMGCIGPKSVISVRNDKSFLDLCVRQIEYLNTEYDVEVPLVLMNSFNTHDDTAKILRKYSSHRCPLMSFNQSKYPRISKESLAPVPNQVDSKENWYPPGHGDLYMSLYNSGRLDELISQGKEWLFISNIDNLGATVDMNILNYLSNTNPDCEFLMEVTDKTRADVKGGTLINYEGRMRLLEIAQVPNENLEEFKSIKKFRIFNTNNLWLKLSAIKRLCEDKSIEMEIIENKKTTDTGLRVIQLETAVGSAIKCFQNGMGINVPRSRFLPVKKTSDLFLVMSNLYTLKRGQLLMSSARMFPTVPLIKLGRGFTKVKDFAARFANIPDIIELDHLTVTGDVNFGSNVVLKGTVIIVANHGERIDIPSGSVLENKVVSGNLRILDH